MIIISIIIMCIPSFQGGGVDWGWGFEAWRGGLCSFEASH